MRKTAFYHQCLKVPVVTKEPLELLTASKKDAQFLLSPKHVVFLVLKELALFKLFSLDNVTPVTMDVPLSECVDYPTHIVTKCHLLDFVIKCANPLKANAYPDIYSLKSPEESLVKSPLKKNNSSKMMTTLKTLELDVLMNVNQQLTDLLALLMLNLNDFFDISEYLKIKN